jgi:hypothetical protein
MKKPRPLTPAQMEKTQAMVADMRAMLGNEADLMIETHHQPRLTAYVLLTVSIRVAMENGMDPEQFGALCADTIDMFCGNRKPQNHHLYAPLSDDP